MMDYGKVIQDSFTIFWKHKVLWLFGILLALAGQREYGFNVNYQESYSRLVDVEEVPYIPNPFDHPFIRNIFENPVPYILGGVLLALVWWVASIFIGWLSQGALIKMVDEIKHTGVTSLRNGWQAGKARIKPLFSLAVVFALPQLILSLPVALGGLWLFFQLLEIAGPAVLVGEIPPSEQMSQKVNSLISYLLAASACLTPLAGIGSILGWTLGILNKIAARSCVLENLDMVGSIKRGWHIARGNLGYTLLNWIILAVAGGIFGGIGVIPGLLMANSFFHNGWSALSGRAVILMGLYLLIVGVVIGGILNTFNSILWTRLYQEFLKKESRADSANTVQNAAAEFSG